MMKRCVLSLVLVLVACDEETTDARGTSSGGGSNDGNNSNSNNNNNNTADDVDCDTLDFEPCGGDVVGTWDATALCPNSLTIPISEAFPEGTPCVTASECDDSSITVTITDIDGTTTFSASDTYTSEGTAKGSLESTTSQACYDAINACLPALLQWDSFEDFCTTLEAYMDDGAAEYDFTLTEGPTCTVNGTNCECTGSGEQDLDDSGTYETSGSTITLTNDEGERQADYCVDGDQTIVRQETDDPDQEVLEVYTK